MLNEDLYEVSYKISRMPKIAQELNSFFFDCAITVALKISDESCKMNAYEKYVFMLLYESLPNKKSDFFDDDIFDLITKAQILKSPELIEEIKKHREAAMEMITRPRMKVFKAYVRSELLE